MVGICNLEHWWKRANGRKEKVINRDGLLGKFTFLGENDAVRDDIKVKKVNLMLSPAVTVISFRVRVVLVDALGFFTYF